jgi:hypothetical protein
MDWDIGKAFTFVTEDPRWVNKVLIGGGLIIAGLLAIFTIIGWLFVFAIVLGYLVQLTRNVIAGQERPLPEWADWGTLMGDGFKTFAVLLVLSLPIIVVAIIFSVPGAILSSADNSGVSATGTLLSIIGGCLTFPLAIIVGLLQPIAIARYAVTRNIGAALRLGELFGILRSNFVTYLVVFLLTYAASFLGQLGILLCGIGLPFTIFYSQLVTYHLYGQAYRKVQGALPGLGQPQQAYPQSFPY